MRHPELLLRPIIRRIAGPTEVDCSLFTGQHLRVVIPEIVGTDIYRHAYIEPDLTRVLIETLGPGGVFVDVGAHYGYHSLIASQIVEPGGLVVAFEPTTATFDLLSHNLRGLSNVRARQAAVGEAPGTTTLHDFGARSSALNTVFDSARVPARERDRLRDVTYRVPCVSLDQLMTTEALAPDVVKLDAEGSELSILRGMRGLLSDHGPMITLETGDYLGMPGPRTDACIDYLENFGYQCLEYVDGLRPHRRQSTYGYGNLYFIKSR